MMKEEYNIEPLQEQDVDTVVNMVRESFDKKYLIPSIYRGKGISKFITNELENKFSPYRYFVLKYDGKIAGYTEFKIFENSSTAFLNIICVSNDFRNKGIANKIFDYTKTFFTEAGFKSMALDVYESNHVALNWYRKCGFNQTGFNLFYKINIDKEIKNHEQLYIQNFSQQKELQKVFGFYFLDIVIKDENIKLGTISKDLIVRGKCSELLKKNLSTISNDYKIETVYYIGSNETSTEFEFIDKILRLELNINL